MIHLTVFDSNNCCAAIEMWRITPQIGYYSLYTFTAPNNFLVWLYVEKFNFFSSLFVKTPWNVWNVNIFLLLLVFKLQAKFKFFRQIEIHFVQIIGPIITISGLCKFEWGWRSKLCFLSIYITTVNVGRKDVPAPIRE